MQVRILVAPFEDGLDVVIWGRWTQGTMRVRHFENRTEMVATLENLRLIGPQEAKDLENFVFKDYCPLYTSEVEEEVLAAHGFRPTESVSGIS